MTTRWISEQLQRMGAARATAPQIPRYNPRTAGLIRPGCASEIVLAVLVYRSPVFLTFAQIQCHLGFSRSAITFALAYLERMGHIESTSDDGRNPRYRRYRVTEKGKEYAATRL